jgi:hypothetical protein
MRPFGHSQQVCVEIAKDWRDRGGSISTLLPKIGLYGDRFLAASFFSRRLASQRICSQQTK